MRGAVPVAAAGAVRRGFVCAWGLLVCSVAGGVGDISRAGDRSASAAPPLLIERWSRSFPADIDWLSLRAACNATVALLHTRDGWLHVLDAEDGTALRGAGWPVELGTQIVPGVCEADWVAVRGRFSVSGLYLGNSVLDATAGGGSYALTSGGFWQVGAPLLPARDARGDPEFLGGMTAGGQNNLGILVASAGRSLRLLRNDTGETRGGWQFGEDVRQIEPCENDWVILSRAAGRFRMTWFDPASNATSPVRMTCDLGNLPPTWFGTIGPAAACVGPSAIDLVWPDGTAQRIASAGEGLWLPNQTGRAIDRTGRVLLLALDRNAMVTAFDCEQGVRVWSCPGDPGSEATLVLDRDGAFVVRVQTGWADCIDLLTGRLRARVAFPLAEPVLSMFAENACLMLITRVPPGGAAVNSEAHPAAGRIRAWWLEDGAYAGARNLAVLPEGARVAHNESTLIIHARNMITTYALDLP